MSSAVLPIRPSGTSRQRFETSQTVLKPSKNWVVPPRAKPGRKPHKQKSSGSSSESPPSTNTADVRPGVGSRDSAIALRKQLASLQEQHQEIVTKNQQDLAVLRLELAQAKSEISRLVLENDHLKATLQHDASNERPNKRPRRGTNYYEHSVVVTSSPVVQTVETSSRAPCEVCPASDNCVCSAIGYTIDRSKAPAAQPSALNEYSVASSAVPLRLRTASARPPATQPVWRIDAGPSSSQKPALCSGDPTNCAACRDDPFGKAFCNALSTSVCSLNPCPNCPGLKRSVSDIRTSLSEDDTSLKPSQQDEEDATLFDALTDLPCCGDPKECGSKVCDSNDEKKQGEEAILPKSVPVGVRTNDAVPCNEAWATLKAHPNIAFADLQLLADVVARRTMCDGPGKNVAETGKRLTVERQAVDDALAVLDRQQQQQQP